MKVKFTIGGNVAIVSLNNSTAAKKFSAQLPLTLTFKDFGATEKISYLPEKLSYERALDAHKYGEGDFAYYTPWGNIAVFYKGTETATSDLQILGNFESGKEFFNQKVPFKATVEIIK